MNKLCTAALGLAVAGLPILAAPALAQDGPVLVADASVACGRVTLTADVLRNLLGENDAYELAVSAGAEGEATAEIGRFLVDFVGDPVSRTFTFDEDEFGGTAVVAWNTVTGPERDVFVSGAVEVDTDCSDEPAPTTTPPPTTTPAPDPVDQFDCDDFATRADAQAKLNETLPEDPHKLDLDSDGIACEVAELTVSPSPTPAPADVDVTVVTPRGGVNTGGGPA